MRRGYMPLNKAAGLALLSMGIGMLLVIIIPGWSFLLALALVALGFWIFFMWC